MRSDRYASAGGEVGSLTEITTGLAFFRHEATIGTVASMGAPLTRSTASPVVSVSSRLSRRNAAPMPRMIPAISPSRAFCTGLGELGEVGTVAGVTSSSPEDAVAPATWSWASWPLSTACWLERAASCAAELAGSLPISLLITPICLVSWPSAAVRLLIEVVVDQETKALA